MGRLSGGKFGFLLKKFCPHHLFRGRDVLESEALILFINFLEMIFGNMVQCIPLLDDLRNNLRLSQFGELMLVKVVLLA